MANVHIKTAARNLQQAVSDIDTKESQIKSDKEDLKRTIDSQVLEIKGKQAILRGMEARSEDAADRTSIRVQINKLENDISDLQKRRFEIENDSKKQIQNLESKKVQIKQVSGNLQSMA